MDNPYSYPPPYGYPPPPPPPPPPSSNPYQSPPPHHLYPSASFPSQPPYPQPQFNHSGPLQYPPLPQLQPAYPPPPPPASYSYEPSFSPKPDLHPYVYPHTDPNSSSFHRPDSYSYPPSHSDSFSAAHHQGSPAALSTQSSISSSTGSSIYPIDDLLANVRLHDGALGAPPVSAPSAYPPRLYDYQHQSSSGGLSYFSPAAQPLPSPDAFGDLQHGPIVPFVGSSPSQHGASLKVLLLHGSLDIWVYDAKNLPNMDIFSKTISDMLGPRLTSTISGKVEHVTSITSDPYVTIEVCGAAIGRTYVLSNSENPVWTQHFNVPVAHHAAEVEFLVKDSDVVGSQLIGKVSIPAVQIYSGQKVEGVYPILNSNGKPCHPGAILRLSIQYTPVERLSIYHHGVGAGPDYCGVPDTYFPLRTGGKVKLYQDAHVPDGWLPDLMLGNGMHYERGKCWRDIFDAMSQARRLIYIVGWSVFHTVRLVRDSGSSSSPILGNLLKSKSQEGVRVLLLVWDDPTSRNILGYRTVTIHSVSSSCFTC